MSREQRFFLPLRRFVVIWIVIFFVSYVSQAEDRVSISDDKISLILPAGWEKSDLNEKVVEAGFATEDQRSSAFFTKYGAGTRLSMQELMDMTIANFEKQFLIRKESDSVTGQVRGPAEKKWPAIFKTFEATVDNSGDEFEMRFYLMIFDVGSQLYLLQATTTMPVREAREKQIYEMIRSLVAKP